MLTEQLLFFKAPAKDDGEKLTHPKYPNFFWNYPMHGLLNNLRLSVKSDTFLSLTESRTNVYVFVWQNILDTVNMINTFKLVLFC